MTTEKYFDFDLQLFAEDNEVEQAKLDPVTIKGSGSNVSLDGSATETGEADTLTGEDSIAAAVNAQDYSPEENDVVTVNDTEYTYDGAKWTYAENATDEQVTAILDEVAGSLADDEKEVTLDSDGITYTYSDDNWSKPVEDEATTNEIITKIATDRGEVEVADTNYTYNADNDVWNYDAEAEDAQITEILDEVAGNLADDEKSVDLEGDATYTYNDNNNSWGKPVEDEATTNEIITKIATDRGEVEVDGANYTYDGDKWTAEATEDQVTEILDTVEGDLADAEKEIDLDGKTYVYQDDDAQWFEKVTEDNADDTLLAAFKEEIAGNDGAFEYDGKNYTYNAADNTLTYADDNGENVAVDEVDETLINAFKEEIAGNNGAFEYDGKNYTYEADTLTYIAADAVEDEVRTEILTQIATDRGEVEVDGANYAYDGDKWTADATEDQVTEILDAVANNLEDEEKEITLDDGNTYTYSDDAESWSEVVTDEDKINEIITKIATDRGEVEVAGTNYTYDAENEVWNYSAEATEEQVTEILDEVAGNLTDAEKSVTIDEVNYTYSDDAESWSEIVTDADTVKEIITQIATERGEVEVDGTNYAYNDNADVWNYDMAASEENSTAADYQYKLDNLKKGDTATVDEKEYTYSRDGEWVGEVPTITTYYKFEGTAEEASIAVDTYSTADNGEAENTSLAAPVTLAGGDNTQNLVLDGVGTIGGLGTDEYIAVTSSSSEVALVDVNGEIEITTAKKTTSVGDTEFKTEKGKVLNLAGDGSGAVEVAADDVTVESFGANQTFVVDNNKTLTYGKVEYTGAGDDKVTLSNNNTSTSYINATIEEGTTGLKVAKSGSRSNRVDQIDVNGALISGAASVAAEITAVTDGIQVAAKDTGKITVGADSAELADGSNALITGTGDDAAIAAISALKTGGKWVTNQEKVTLGANTQVWNFSETDGAVTITGDKTAGTTASKVEFNAGTATLTENTADTLKATKIDINGAAEWNVTVTNEDTPIDEGLTFNAEGNVTLNSDDEKNLTAIVEISGGKDKLFSNGNTGDVISVTNGDTLNIYGYNDSIRATEFGEWTVKTNAAIVGAGTAKQTLVADAEKGAEYKAIVTSGKKRNTFGEITGLSGNATVSYGADAPISGLKVAEKTWSIDGDDDKAVLFDKEGNASVSGNAVVTGEANAKVTVIGANSATINKTTVDIDYDADGVEITLEEGGYNQGIAAISGADVTSNIRINGDNSYEINGYTFNSTSRNDADIFIGESSMIFDGVNNKDAITLSGDGGASFDFNKIEGEINATLNGVGITVEAGDKDGRNLYVSGDKDGINVISGVKIEDTITTDKDDSFSVSYYDSLRSTFASDDENGNDKIVINDLSIEIVEGSGKLKEDSHSIFVSADKTNGMADVVLTGIDFDAEDTLKVSKGTYKIGKSAAVTVNESVGYITFDSLGNAEAEDGSAHDNREDREKPAEEALAATTDVDAFKVYFGTENLPSNVENSTVAGFENAKTEASDVRTSAAENGINIYGDVSLGSDKLSYVTLQSAVADDINIVSEINGTSGLRTAVIDVSEGQNTMVAISASNAVNHTILGSNNKSDLVIGAAARGNNYIQAGSVGSYLFNQSSAASTLLGGAGSDSILAGEHDYVLGNGGADYFYDKNGTDSDTRGYVVRDYNLAEGDVIVGTKLSEVRGNLKADTLASKIEVTDKTIAIAGGPAITIQAAEGEFAQNIIMSDSSGEIRHNVTWAKESGGVLDTSAFGDSVATFMLANKNGMADSITGSTGNDTIFAGGNDTVNTNGGHDEIYLTAADTDKMESGAVVIMNGDKGGRHYVNNWKFGFDETEGVNILDIGNNNLYFEVQGESLVAVSGNDTLSFVGSGNVDTMNVLTAINGENKRVSVLRQGTNVVVDDEDDLGIFYHAVGSNSSVEFTKNIGTIDQVITLGSVEYESIANMILANEGTATVIGDDIANEVVELTGQAENDARKSVSLGGGNDSIISTGTDTALAGNDIYFGLGNDGNDVISNFAYYQGFDKDPEADAADILFLYGTGAESTIVADEKNIELRINNNEKLNLKGETDANNMIRFHINGENQEHVAKIGVSEGKNNNFTYQEEVDVYYGNFNLGEDTLTVAEEDKTVEIWLDGSKGTGYTGIGAVDASAAINTQLTLVGGHGSNTITGGGEGSRSSLWGGGYGNNELIGGAGDDVFIFTKESSSRGNNDTISGIDADNDRILLYDLTLDDIDLENSSATSLKFKSGGSLTIDTEDAGVKVSLLENGNHQEYVSNAEGDWEKTE